jgi:hypothetical protein
MVKNKCGCFVKFKTFIIGIDVKLADCIITKISAHLNTLKKNFDCYFLEERKTVSRRTGLRIRFRTT